MEAFAQDAHSGSQFHHHIAACAWAEAGKPGFAFD